MIEDISVYSFVGLAAVMKKMFILILLMVATVLSLQLFADEKSIVIEAPQASPEIMIDQIEASSLILHASAFKESLLYSQNLEKQLFLLTQNKPLSLSKGVNVAAIMP
jgi:hypothetical protein